MELSGDNVPGGSENKIEIVLYGVLCLVGLIVASFFIDDFRIIIGGGSVIFIGLLIGYGLAD